MASAVATEIIGSELFVQSYDHDPGGTTAILGGPDGGTTIRYLDMKDYSVVGVQVRPTIITTSLTRVELVASAVPAMTSVTVVKDSGAVVADSLNDTVFLECTDAEVIQLGATLRYVAVRITTTTSTDEANFTYIAIPKRKVTGLTATLIT